MTAGATMTGLWLEDGVLELREDLPVPYPPDGEVRVRVLVAGICNTDLELLRGYAPFAGVPGHEFVGVVDEGPAEWLGRRVVGEINVSCGGCAACGAGRSAHCEEREVLGIRERHGAFAEFLVLPAENLHLVPDAVPDEAAVFAEPLAAALRVEEQVSIGPGDRVLVVGDGKLGLLVAQVLARERCELTVLGRHREKLALLDDMVVRTLIEGEGTGPRAGTFDVAVEATGNPEGFRVARDALRPMGTLALKSTYADELVVDASSLVVDEVTVVGSRCGPFPPALGLLEEGTVDPRPMIDDRFPLARGLEAFDRAQERGVLKVLLHAEGAA